MVKPAVCTAESVGSNSWPRSPVQCASDAWDGTLTYLFAAPNQRMTLHRLVLSAVMERTRCSGRGKMPCRNTSCRPPYDDRLTYAATKNYYNPIMYRPPIHAVAVPPIHQLPLTNTRRHFERVRARGCRPIKLPRRPPVVDTADRDEAPDEEVKRWRSNVEKYCVCRLRNCRQVGWRSRYSNVHYAVYVNGSSEGSHRCLFNNACIWQSTKNTGGPRRDGRHRVVSPQPW